MEDKAMEVGQQSSRIDDNLKSSSSSENEKGRVRRSWDESKKIWKIAGPAMLVAVSQFSLTLVTTAFVGYLGSLQLAAVSVVQTVIQVFDYGIMVGMSSALGTLCGQAVGAGKINMLGIYLQRSWIITGTTALLLTPVHICTSLILKLFHQDKHISNLAGNYAVWVIPQVFAYAVNYPIQKFHQSQSKLRFMMIASILVLGTHVLLNWVFVIKFSLGLLGAAIAGNISWFLLIFSQVVYIVSGFFPDAWTGLSFLAFKSLKNYIKLSLASALMLCLELWYFTVIILVVGRLSNPKIEVDAVSICMNLVTWSVRVAIGFNAAVSVRVSNELGAGRPKAAKVSIIIAFSTSVVIGAIFAVSILVFKEQFAKVFSDEPLVIHESSKLGYLLAATMFIISIQLVNHGVAVGAGWQITVALVNMCCYYIIGITTGALLGFKFSFGVRGIWSGMLIGFLLQTLILFIIVWRTNWHKEALQAAQRMRTWDDPANSRQQQPSVNPASSKFVEI